MNILFVCEYNACRSQIAEGLARTLLPADVRVESAGVHPGEVSAVTVEVMKEIGIDISSHRSKRLDAVADRPFDLVVVLAEPAVGDCARRLKAGKTRRWFYSDPAKGEDLETVKRQLREFRDALKERMGDLLKEET